MIWLTRLNDSMFVLNASLIETIEANPDTTVTTTSGKKMVVKEPVDEVVKLAVKYRQSVYGGTSWFKEEHK